MPEPLLSTVLSAVVFLLLAALILQLKRCRQLKLRFGKLEIQFEETQRPAESFSEDLILAERDFQESVVKQGHDIPERYRYIRAMARQGMSATQIATILKVGEEEAEQIIRLARLKSAA
jgi:predicted Holliday junction resolvase-like endonuclease